MVRVLFGQDAQAVKDVQADLTVAEAKLRTLSQTAASDKAARITLAAELESVQQVAEQLAGELYETQTALRAALAGARLLQEKTA